jgi:penicillin G amidase
VVDDVLGFGWELAQKLTVDQINQVMPLLSNPPSAIGDYAALYKSLGLATAMAQTAPLLAMMPDVGVEGIGSNNWVLHGSRTTSGKPLLANDPHLSLQAPSLWYMAKVEAGGYQLSGGTLPGIPFFPLGRNQFIAWGATNTGSDVQDLFIERFNPADPNSVLGPQGLEPTQLVLETIKIKGEKDLPLNVRYTRRGPLISDVHEGVKKALGDTGFGMSLRWTALDTDNLTVQAGLRLNLAKSVAEVQTALKDYAAPTQNIVFADAQGNIGWLTVGNEPIRAAANDLHGLAPAPAWEAKYQWQGYVPFEQWPREVNPDRAYIATANNNILPDGYPFYLGSEWTLPFRAQRAAQLIEVTPKHDVNSMKAMHADVQSLAFSSFMRSVKGAEGGALAPSTELGKQALALLGKFDGVMSADRAEPLIVSAWQLQLSRAIFADEVGAQVYEKLMSRRDGFGAVLLAMSTQSAMCDNTTTPAVETCAQTASKALDDACAQLATNYGSNISKWRWGEAHIARAEHRPFGKQPLLAKLFDLRAATPGDTYTLNVGRMANTGEAPFTNVHAASLRAVYDMAAPQAAWLMQSTGQSGHRMSSHYSDLKDRWVAVQYVDMAASKPDQVLRLLP